MTKETWKQLDFAPAYEVSSSGKVRRPLRAQGSVAGLVLKPWLQKDRPCVQLSGYTTIPGRVRPRAVANQGVGPPVTVYVARLVAYAFLPPPDGPVELGYRDGDPTNVAAENLHWYWRLIGYTPAERMRLYRQRKKDRRAEIDMLD